MSEAFVFILPRLKPHQGVRGLSLTLEPEFSSCSYQADGAAGGAALKSHFIWRSDVAAFCTSLPVHT